MGEKDGVGNLIMEVITDSGVAVLVLCLVLRELFNFIRWLVTRSTGKGDETPDFYLKEIHQRLKHVSRVADRLEDAIRRGRGSPYDSEW